MSQPLPSDDDLGNALNALEDAIDEANSDALMAQAYGDGDGAARHLARAESLRRVYAWLLELEP